MQVSEEAFKKSEYLEDGQGGGKGNVDKVDE